MQCFICVTYMFFICSAHPRRAGSHDERSLFHDVIESLKIRAQLPEDTNQNEENNIGQIYERYGYDDELRLPIDTEFVPRRNDRIALPPLKYRLPKMLVTNETAPSVKLNNASAPKEEIVVFISTPESPKPSTEKVVTKTTKQPIKKKPNMGNENNNKTLRIPVVNTMADQSHIGNKEIHMVVNPNIVVNFRSSENNNDLKLEEAKNTTEKVLRAIVPQNVFNIHQEIKLERDLLGSDVPQEESKDEKKVKQSIKVMSRDVKPKVEEDMMMRETATWDPENNRTGRKFKNVLEILLSL